MCVCVCVCVCARARACVCVMERQKTEIERLTDRKGGREGDRQTENMNIVTALFTVQLCSSYTHELLVF